jgi:integrase
MGSKDFEHHEQQSSATRPVPDEAQFGQTLSSAPNPTSTLSSIDVSRHVNGWDGRGLARLEYAVARAISQFSPRRVPEDQWRRIETLVRESATKAAPKSAYSASQLMTVLSELAIWIDTIGLPLDPAVVLTPDNIDRFITDGCAHLALGTQSNYRRQLRIIGAAVLGAEVFPTTQLPIPRPPPLAPYSPSDIAALRSWSRGLPSDAYRQGIATILAFCLGTGITSPELYRMAGTDVSVGEDGVTVHVSGHRTRGVEVLEVYASEVAELAQAAGDGPVFAPQRSGDLTGRSQVTNFIFTCPKGDAPHLNPIRLRNTWIVSHISAGTHLVTLTEAAGVEVAAIAKLAIYATAPEPREARRMLREAPPG